MTNIPPRTMSRRTYSNEVPLERAPPPTNSSILLTYIRQESASPSAFQLGNHWGATPPPPLLERNVQLLSQTRQETVSSSTEFAAVPPFNGDANTAAASEAADDDGEFTALLDRLGARHARTLGRISQLLQRAAEHRIYANDVRQAGCVAQTVRTAATAGYFARIKRSMHLDNAKGTAWGNPGTRQDMLSYLIQTSIEDAKAEFLLMEVKATEELIDEQIGRECETALELQRQIHEAESIVELILAPEAEAHTPQVRTDADERVTNALPSPPSKRQRRDDVSLATESAASSNTIR